MLSTTFLVSAALGAAAAQQPANAPRPEGVSYAKQVKPILAKYCFSCHGGAKPKAGMALDKVKDGKEILKSRKVWEKVIKQVRSREMPPPRRPKPAEAEIDLLASFVETQLAKVNCNGPVDPGRVTIRRLNRIEYRNTIRDLVGVRFDPSADFPADDIGYGFDNIGDVLSLSPLLMEKYLTAAEKVVRAAFNDEKTRNKIMTCRPTGNRDWSLCGFKILHPFAKRAYRRPVKPEEVQRLVRLVKLAQAEGDTFDNGIQLALQAVLVSPHFLFRIENDLKPDDPTVVHPISEYELATRLSYFLWSSMPDEELIELAGKGQLRALLAPQVQRMLKDPKARALVENFAGQWLQVRKVKTVTPDPKRFPAFDDALRSAMLEETTLFFGSVVDEDRSIFDLLQADYTYLNERLARHYGIDGIKGKEFRRVQLKDNRRGGILTQASVLTITSNPTRTSPVKRGKWILETILGTPPPPPAPDAGELAEGKEAELKGTLRQRMEQHRAKPSCAVCHQKMDPLGFAFENFDAIGAWRTRDGKHAIDPSGKLPGGVAFKGPAQLKDVLSKKEELFRRCLTEKLLTYALGRGLEYYDKCAVDRISEELAKNDDRFSILVMAIVKSEPFQKRRGKRKE